MRTSFIRAVIVLVGGCLFSNNLCLAAEPNGILKIEGKYIRQLILYGKHQEVLEEPNETVRLPVGTYYVSEIKLQGYTSRSFKVRQFDIKEGQATVLQLGAPLSQTVNVSRRGNSLVLNYKLQGIGGESYFPDERGSAPKCAIYQGGKEIANCSFKYG